MDYMQLIANFASTIVAVGMGLGWIWKRLDRKFDYLSGEIKEIKTDIRKIDVRLARLEGQDEERFRNEVKLLAKKVKPEDL